MKITKLPPGPVPAKQSTPHSALIEQLMDSRIPKTEREHAAQREIEMLREALRLPPAIEQTEKQEQAEPVAWLQITRYGNKLLSFREPPKTEYPSYCGKPTPDPVNYPLYAAPAALRVARTAGHYCSTCGKGVDTLHLPKKRRAEK